MYSDGAGEDVCSLPLRSLWNTREGEVGLAIRQDSVIQEQYFVEHAFLCKRQTM